MQDYKIRIPNAEISRQVQEKAFELGYIWASGDVRIRYTDHEIAFYPRFIEIVSNRIFIPAEGNTVLTIPEISYQDFLRLGEIDVNNCKIRIPSGNIIFDLREKLESLGVKGYGNSPAIRAYGYPDYSDLHGISRPMFMYVRDGLSSMIGTEEYLNSRPEKELTVEQIMQLQSTINNTTTEEIMSGEITLKCITAPQKAKNITEGRDYTGILIDSDDTQVDSLREAKYFRCVNNNGIEAKYKLALFAKPEPPRPQFPTWEQIESGIYINEEEEVVLYFNDEEHIIYDNEDGLNLNSDMRCCGLDEIDGIQSLHRSIEVSCRFDLLEDNTNQQRLKDLVFKTLVNNAIEENSGAFRIFTLVSGHDAIDTLMQEIMAERGGVQTEYRRSTSSSNNIKVFVINL